MWVLKHKEVKDIEEHRGLRVFFFLDIEVASNDARVWDGQADGETSGRPSVNLSTFLGR